VVSGVPIVNEVPCDFENLQICQVLSSSEVLIGEGFVYVCS
jgi:hypothetical protein